MIFNLLWKNFKAQFYGYLIYFVSMTFAVVIYYCFNAITYNQLLVARVGQEISISGAMSFGGAFIIILISGFMLAANHFFLMRRSKEIGLYHLMGVRKSQISLLFLLETLLLGTFSLVIGIGLGIILSKLFSMILVKAMFLQVESLFFISIPSMFQTALVFGFTLIMVSISSCWTIYHYQLEALFLRKRKKGTDPNELTKIRLFFGIIGPILIVFGYFLAYNIVSFTTVLMKGRLGFTVVFLTPLFIMLICMLGTYFFYKNTMNLIIHLIEKKEKNYYQNLRMVALGNVKFQIKSRRKTLTFITIFIAIALGMIGGAASLYTLGMHSVNLTAPTDFIVAETEYQRLKTEIEKEPDTRIKESVRLTYKLTGSMLHYKIGQEEWNSIFTPMNVLSLSDYLNYQKINPYLKNINSLDEQEAILIDSIQNVMKGFIRYESPIILQGDIKMKIVATRPDFLGQPLLRYDFPTIVVSDEQFQTISSSLSYRLIALNIDTINQEAVANRLSENMKTEWIAPVYYNYLLLNGRLKGYVSESSKKGDLDTVTPENGEERELEHWRLNYINHFPELRYKRREMGLFIYVAMFLGILSLLITGSILMLRQFSELARERSNYELLKRIGVSKKEITRLVYQQNSLIFFPPMIIGILHASFAIFVFSKFVESSGYWLAYLSCGLLILFYLFFYLLTSAIYARIIFSKNNF